MEQLNSKLSHHKPDMVKYIMRRLREKNIVISTPQIQDMRKATYRISSPGEFMDVRESLTHEELTYYSAFILQ